jgi:hypothetical protein
MAWELVLKRTPTDEEWRILGRKIMADELPANRQKYVKYSVLDNITRNMVQYYLKRGLRNPKLRQASMKGILEEMARSSNVRFDVEDKSKNPRDE